MRLPASVLRLWIRVSLAVKGTGAGWLDWCRFGWHAGGARITLESRVKSWPADGIDVRVHPESMIETNTGRRVDGKD